MAQHETQKRGSGGTIDDTRSTRICTRLFAGASRRRILYARGKNLAPHAPSYRARAGGGGARALEMTPPRSMPRTRFTARIFSLLPRLARAHRNLLYVVTSAKTSAATHDALRGDINDAHLCRLTRSLKPLLHL